MIRKNYLLWALALTLMASAAQAQLRSQTGIFGAGQPGEVSVVRMEVKKLGIKDFQMQSRQVDGRLAIDAFSGRLGNGLLSGRGLVDWSRPEDQQRMTIQVQNVDVMSLLTAFKVKFDARVSAVANGTIDTQWRGVRGTLPRESMNGTIRLQLGPGTISGASVLEQVAHYTGIAQARQFTFSSGVVEGTIQNGMLSFSKVELSGQDQYASGAGLMDLRTEEIRLQFKGAISPQMIAASTMPQVRGLGQAAETIGGGDLVKLPLIVTMGGSARAPQFNVQWQAGEASGN